MTQKYTLDDIPMILNSISWQLKRIADVMEKEEQIKDITPKPESKISKMIRDLNFDNDQ